ncbi:MAG TPA: baseplate J/gp47 family protein [Candidatus Limnocylindrales bacterium]
MPAIVYLDVDDEITSAAARIRDGGEKSLALVVPSGSRLATSRMNFRLLAREAQVRDRRLAIVAGDGATRALAASAGLPVFGSVGEYEAAPNTPPSADPGRPRVRRRDPTANPTSASRPNAGTEPTLAVATPPEGAIAAAGATPAPTGARSIPAVGARPMPRLPVLAGTNALVAAAVLALAVVVIAVAAWLLLPSASIAVTARPESIGPLTLNVIADPSAQSVDAAAGVVPARRLSFDLRASDTFTATDRRIAETPATGSVIFRSYDTGSSNTIPRGSVVATEGGIQFRTLRAVTLARARLVLPSTVLPSSASVAVEAVTAGTAANVPENAIRIVPRGEDPAVTTVNNPEPTSGGTHEEFPRIGQADVDAAMERLTRALGTDFDALLADPATTPDGVTLLIDSKSLGDVTPSVEPAGLVGDEVESFELTLGSTGTVVGVDTSVISALAESRLGGTVGADHRLVEDSVDVEFGSAVVDGERVRLPVEARASQVRVLDAEAIRQQVKGRPLAEARSILESYGDVRLDVWPDWVTSVPTIDFRLDVSVTPSR